MDILCTPDTCPVLLNATCVFYRGDQLVYTGINNGDNLEVVIQKINDTIQAGGIAEWGNITGTLTSQIDLIAYLTANYYPLNSNPAGYITLATLPTFENGITESLGVIRLGGPLTGDTQITGAFDLSLGTTVSRIQKLEFHSIDDLLFTQSGTNNVIIGKNITATGGTTVTDNFYSGVDHVISSQGGNVRWSVVFGEANKLTNLATVAGQVIHDANLIGGYNNEIKNNIGYAIYNPAILGGANNVIETVNASISQAFIMGRNSRVQNSYGISMGFKSYAYGFGSFVHGITNSANLSTDSGEQPVLASGRHAVNISSNSLTQTVGHGALADYSVILGGYDHNIPADSPRSVILGGNAIKARATDPDQVYVPNLNIVSTPDTDNTLNSLLVWDPVTGEIKIRSFAGHEIIDQDDNPLPQQPKLKFERLNVTDDALNNQTVVTRPADTFVGITPPSNPVEGDIWKNSEDWKTYVWYDSFWVEQEGSGSQETIFYRNTGNSFGADSILGLTDNFNLTLQTGNASIFFKTSGIDRAVLNSSGNFILGGTSILANTRFHIRGIGTTTQNAFYVDNSSALTLFQIQDNGNINFGSSTRSSFVTINQSTVDGTVTGLRVLRTSGGSWNLYVSGNEPYLASNTTVNTYIQAPRALIIRTTTNNNSFITLSTTTADNISANQGFVTITSATGQTNQTGSFLRLTGSHTTLSTSIDNIAGIAINHTLNHANAAATNTYVGIRIQPTITNITGLPNRYAVVSNFGYWGLGTLTPTYMADVIGLQNNDNLLRVRENGGSVLFEIIETSSVGQIAFWGVTPINRPTTAFASSTYSAVGGTTIQTNDTFDGYTVGQVINALRQIGILT